MAVKHIRLQTDLQQLVRKHDFDKARRNTTATERNEIIALQSEEDVTITRSDKGGEMVVMRESQLHQLCLDHLNDTTTYEQLKTDPANATRIKITKNLDRSLTDCYFPENPNTQPTNTVHSKNTALLRPTKDIQKRYQNTTYCLGMWRNLWQAWLAPPTNPQTSPQACRSPHRQHERTPTTIQQHWQKQPQRYDPRLLWCCSTLHQHQHWRSNRHCSRIHYQNTTSNYTDLKHTIFTSFSTSFSTTTSSHTTACTTNKYVYWQWAIVSAESLRFCAWTISSDYTSTKNYTRN